MFKKLKEKIEETSGEDLRNAATSFMPPIPALKKDTRASQGSIAHGSQKSLASISASMTSISDQTIVQDLSSNQVVSSFKINFKGFFISVVTAKEVARLLKTILG